MSGSEQVVMQSGGSPVVGAVVTLLILAVVAAGLFIFFPSIVGRLMSLAKQAKEEVSGTAPSVGMLPESDPITSAMADMNKTLSLMLRRGAKAQELASEVELHTLTLVNMIEGFVYKVADFATEREALQVAMRALSTGDTQMAAGAAGMIRDPSLAQAVLTLSVSPELRGNIQRVLAHEIGSLRQWENTYVKFSNRLLDEVAKTRGTLHTIKASLELLEVAEPMVQIETSLTQATKLLQIAREPEQAKLLRTQGGTVSSRLLLG